MATQMIMPFFQLCYSSHVIEQSVQFFGVSGDHTVIGYKIGYKITNSTSVDFYVAAHFCINMVQQIAFLVGE